MRLATRIPVNSPGGRLRHPAEIGTCVLWLRGDFGFNAAAGTWLDRSGTGNNCSPTNATLPTATTNINGKSTVTFTALGGVQTPSMSLGQMTVFAVAKTSNAGYVWVHGTDGAVNGAHQFTGVTETNYFARSSVVSQKNFAAGMNDGAVRSIITTFDGTTAGNLLYFGGTLQAETITTGNNPGVGPLGAIFYVGANQAGNTGIGGDIGEIAVFNRIITQSEIARLSDYSKQYWGA